MDYAQNSPSMDPQKERAENVRKEFERQAERAQAHYGSQQDRFVKKQEEAAARKDLEEQNERVKIEEAKREKSRQKEFKKREEEMKAAIEQDKEKKAAEERHKAELHAREEAIAKQHSQYMDDMTEAGRLRTLKEFRKQDAKRRLAEAMKLADEECYQKKVAAQERQRMLMAAIETEEREHKLKISQEMAIRRREAEGAEQRIKSDAINITRAELFAADARAKQRVIDERKLKRPPEAIARIQREADQEARKLKSEIERLAEKTRLDAERKSREQLTALQNEERRRIAVLESEMRRKKADLETETRRSLNEADREAQHKKSRAQIEIRPY